MQYMISAFWNLVQNSRCRMEKTFHVFDMPSAGKVIHASGLYLEFVERMERKAGHGIGSCPF